MKPIKPIEFERKCADAGRAPDVYQTPMIRTQMNRGDWLIMGALALIWGGAFFFIGVAVRYVQPLTYVWLRVTIAALGMWLFLLVKREPLQLPRQVWGSIVLLAVLNNALPFALFAGARRISRAASPQFSTPPRRSGAYLSLTCSPATSG